MEANPFERSRRATRMKVIFGATGVAWIGIFAVIFVWLPAEREEKRRVLRRPFEEAWSRAEAEHQSALRAAVTQRAIVPRPDLGPCDLPKDMKHWIASENDVEFTYGNAYARQVPVFGSEAQAAAWEREVASWDRELDVVTAAFARNLLAKADPKHDYDASYQTTHFYVWDFHERKIVCAGTKDLGAQLAGAREAGAALAKRVVLENGAEVEVTAREIGETRIWRAGPPSE